MKASHPTVTTDTQLPVGFGIQEAIGEAFSALQEAQHNLEQYTATKDWHSKEPFFFDSRRVCVESYLQALRRVRKRFWTTTYLSSGFWIGNDKNILATNQRLIREMKGSDVHVHRLFLLPVPPADEIQRLQDEHISLHKVEDEEGLAHFESSFHNLCRNIEEMITTGCDVRIVYDEEELHHKLPIATHFEHGDSELAIYDDWRFDVFTGGRQGTISSSFCFTPVMDSFDHYLEEVAGYFEQLWAKSKPISSFLDRLRQVIEYSSSRINYQPVWLASYDHGLPEEDRVLKVVELAAVKTEVKKRGRWGKVQRYMDVGTCTGRYPISLRDSISERGEILGIDNDMDCVRFARWNVERECDGDQRIRIERRDFCSREFDITGQFDLITCMLGTLLHFGRNRVEGPPYRDEFQEALEKFATLLTEDGLLFFSVWSEKVLDDLDMLSIYSEEDKRRLAEWTPSREELQSRLEAAGLGFEPPIELEDRMDLYCCRRTASS